MVVVVRKTIFALSSGKPPSGIAVVRLSGPDVRFAFETMIGFVPVPRKMILAEIYSSRAGSLLDRGIVIYFESPNSFTGEDCGEFQIHGGIAVVDAVLECLGSFDNFEIAQPGEFSRRAFENGRIDLTEVEGLADLVSARTEKQRQLAIVQSGGALRLQCENWRGEIIRLRSLIEAELDFSEEEDVSAGVNKNVLSDINVLVDSIRICIDGSKYGEIVRDGFKVALMGPVNSGKSSLLNVLAKRDVAIVSEHAGTTRDVIEVDLDINGYQVTVYDTAGLRKTDDQIESLGIEKAISVGNIADLVIWLNPVVIESDKSAIKQPLVNRKTDVLKVNSKVDLRIGNRELQSGVGISSVTGEGIDDLFNEISVYIENTVPEEEYNVVTRARQRIYLQSTVGQLEKCLLVDFGQLELVSEYLRLASDELGRLVGRVDVEDLLDVIFGEFCIGK